MYEDFGMVVSEHSVEFKLFFPDTAIEKIDYLADFGINAIEFVLWPAWRGGEFSWGYNPFQFFAVENCYIKDSTNSLDWFYRLLTLLKNLTPADCFAHLAGCDINPQWIRIWRGLLVAVLGRRFVSNHAHFIGDFLMKRQDSNYWYYTKN